MDYSKIKHMLNHVKVLYIEDEIYLSNYLEEFLSKLGAIVDVAYNAEDGLELYKKNHPDIMVVDINLPKMNGLEFISKIREIDKNIRIIISSAHTDPEFTLQAVELDITRYLVKPVISEKLLDAFDKAIKEIQEKNNTKECIDLGSNFSYCLKEKQLYHLDQTIDLRKKESLLLEFFIQHQKTLITYEMLETSIWQDGSMTADAIRSQIRNIRNKTHKDIVKNVSGIGYKLYSHDNL
jgi:DNA-binding response OmpR family regulator